MQMGSCEDKLKGKTAHFRLPSASQKRACLSSLMTKDKNLSIFLRQMEAVAFTILQIFFATCVFLKIGEYPRISRSFSWGILDQVTFLDQPRASKYIFDGL